MCLGFLPHNLHPARIFMGDSGSMLIGLMLASSAISITGRVDPEAIARHRLDPGDVHNLVPVYMPLVLPFTCSRSRRGPDAGGGPRTWKGQSPFAADRGHLHHRLLEIGHSHSRAVLIMYFWCALFAFAAVAFSVNSSSLWIVLVIARSSRSASSCCCCRASSRPPRDWAESVVPPRYRRGAAGGWRAGAAAAEREMRSPTARPATAPPRSATARAGRTAGRSGATTAAARSTPVTELPAGQVGENGRRVASTVL